MDNKEINTNQRLFEHKDFSVVKNPARIAVYDDLKSPPRIIEIKPDITNTFIENLSSEIYKHSQSKAGRIPYTVIREISENFIHAYFSEIVVSILDNGNTIRFTDQGPGFSDIEKSQLPGFTSATESMKQYIRGVGSGLPTVKDYLNYSSGNIKIENNINNGAVVTISLLENLNSSIAFSDEDKKESNKIYNEKLEKLNPSLTAKESTLLNLLFNNGPLGVSELSQKSKIPLSSTHKELKNLENKQLIEQMPNKKRVLTEFGYRIINFQNS